MNKEFIKISIASFSIPMVIRLIPELIMYPYPIGFDTVTAYLSKIMYGNILGLGLFDILKKTNLYYLVQQFVYNLVGDPILTIKILGPILYGLLFLSIGLYTYQKYKVDLKHLVIGILIVSISILALRIGWDLYRNMLGLFFAISTLTMLNLDDKMRVLAVLPASLTALSHELATIFLGITIIISSFYRWVKSDYIDRDGLAALSILVGLFTYQRIDINNMSLNLPIVGITLNNLYAESLTLLITYLVLVIPLAIPALYILSKADDIELKVWLYASLVFSLIPVIGVFNLASYRFILMSVFPLSVCIILFMRMIRYVNKRINIIAFTAFIFVILSGSFYLVSTPYTPYTVTYIVYSSIDHGIANDFPIGYLQNTLSLEDVEPLMNVLYMYASMEDGDSKLIISNLFIWISYLDSFPLQSNIIFYDWIKVGYRESLVTEPPINSTVYILWFKDGEWYGLSPDSIFDEPVLSNERFALFEASNL